MAGNAAVLECFDDADISVMQGDIFADQCDRYFMGRAAQCFDHGFPVGQVRLRTRKIQALAGYLSQMLFFHGERCLIEVVDVQILEHMAARNVAEQSDFIFDAFVERML